jgi:hypothetical protein
MAKVKKNYLRKRKITIDGTRSDEVKLVVSNG